MPTVNTNDLRIAMNAALVKMGMVEESASIITDTAIYANLRGIHTHGIGRLPLYAKNIQQHGINCAKPVVVNDDKATALLDAQNGFGQVASYMAMSQCIEKAKEYGVGIVGVRNSNNFGTAAYYGEMATKQGMLAMVMANSSPAMAPTGGKKPVLGTNPLCFAVPGGSNQIPVILDMATTVVARGKIRLAAKQEADIPENWAIDADGHATTNPQQALEGSLLPIGGYKGYGLALFVDIIAGLIMGSAFGGDVKALSKISEESGNGHVFLVVDLKRFLSTEDYLAKMDYLIDMIKASGEVGDVMLPGENWDELAQKNHDSIELPQVQLNEINRILQKYSLSPIDIKEI